MGEKETLYARRLSPDESRNRYVFISKDSLKMFPGTGVALMADVNGKEHELFLESFLCTCRGPDAPHKHHRLSFKDMTPKVRLSRGSVVSIRKDKERYLVNIK